MGLLTADEGRFSGVFEGEVDPLDDLPRLLKFTQEHVLGWHVRPHHTLHLLGRVRRGLGEGWERVRGGLGEG